MNLGCLALWRIKAAPGLSHAQAGARARRRRPSDAKYVPCAHPCGRL